LTTHAEEFVVKILIVENDPYFQRFVATTVKKLGYKFEVVDSSVEAVDILKNDSFSIVFINDITPGFHGLEFLKYITSNNSNTDVIVVTSHQEEINLTDVITAGAVDYLSKPFTVDEVRAKLSRVVRERKLVHELVVENSKRLRIEAELRKSHELLERRVHERTKELEAAKITAEAATVTQTEFMANISHELRTPMHGILSFARLGVSKLNLVTKARLCGYFEEIEKSGNRLLELLNNLLDISKLEAEMMQYSMALNSLDLVVNTAVMRFSAMLEEKKISISVENNIKQTKAVFDKPKIEQVVENLLNNAIKYTDSGNSIQITLSRVDRYKRVSDNPCIVLAIEDQGVGIPKGELAFVFDKFRQSSRTRSGAGGTGLGLAICKQIVQDHHGRIWAESIKEGGTRISFVLPADE
jgi:signal transduction histidine kinase